MPPKISSLVPVDMGVDPDSPFFDPELDPSIYLGPCTQGHEEKFTKARGICKYFARGTCRVLSSCRFLHAKIGFHYDGQAFYRCYKQTKSHPFPCHQLNNEGRRTTNRGFGYHMYLPEGIFENGIWTPLREADGSANARGLEIVRQYRPDYIPRPRPLAKATENAGAPHQTASLFRQPQLDTRLPMTQPWPSTSPFGSSSNPSSWQQHVNVGRDNQEALSHRPYTARQSRMIQPLLQAPVPKFTAPASRAFDSRHDPAIIAIGAAEPSPPPSRPTSGDLFPKAQVSYQGGWPSPPSDINWTSDASHGASSSHIVAPPPGLPNNLGTNFADHDRVFRNLVSIEHPPFPQGHPVPLAETWPPVVRNSPYHVPNGHASGHLLASPASSDTPSDKTMESASTGKTSQQDPDNNKSTAFTSVASRRDVPSPVAGIKG